MRKNRIKKGVLLGIMVLFGIFNMNAQSESKQGKKARTFDELLEKMDANTDGKLSVDEVKGRLKDNFDKVDTDEDGFITKEEFDEMKKNRKSKGKKKKE